jgi:cyclophilin family peptidyl-prolyl cis-trans isomerase
MTPMPQSGATEFAIYTAPNAYGPPEDPELKETVFGRVISGMGVVEALKVNVRFKEGTTATERVNNREGDMPDDIIIAAKVLRKRPNVDYKPKKKESAVK